ncbi:acireductone synthase [Micromonospora sp. DT31]|uniref:acireductone synthase n=1 Tax=Micromonospora sp. DT31 TaxID=3393434 RepID=UPI003CF39ABB
MRAVVVDVEGTTSSGEYVRHTLFGYARRHLPRWLAAHRTDPEVVRALRSAAVLTGHPAGKAGDDGALSDDDLRGLTAVLQTWIDEDAKVTPLKTIQGLMWQEGFAAGELTSHVYPDVPPALRRWHRRDLRLCVFSSGSVTAQRAWFRHTPHGDLLPYLDLHFDTENAGAKSSVDAYLAIAAAVGVAAQEILFLSDSDAEIRAARSAGWAAVTVCRGDAPDPAPGAMIRSFDEIDVTADGFRLVGRAAAAARG